MSEELSSVVEYSIDLNKQDQPEPLPAGKYTGVIRNAEVKESQRGTMYCAVSFHIGADQFPADYKDGNDDGMTLVYRRVGLEDNPQARFGTKRFIESIGAPLSKRIDVSEWVGMEAALEVTHETYEGVTRASIDRVQAA
jgi:hypothetical protein|tara:strand:+ start:685 stop:1101 length:417 start_codon:yes stop_codon:yes gene_type:complete